LIQQPVRATNDPNVYAEGSFGRPSIVLPQRISEPSIACQVSIQTRNRVLDLAAALPAGVGLDFSRGEVLAQSQRALRQFCL
jgi:hypothetical protein